MATIDPTNGHDLFKSVTPHKLAMLVDRHDEYLRAVGKFREMLRHT